MEQLKKKQYDILYFSTTTNLKKRKTIKKCSSMNKIKKIKVSTQKEIFLRKF